MKVNSSTQECVLTALEMLWQKIIEIRAFISPFLFPYHVLLPKEYVNTPFSELGKVADELPNMTEQELFSALSSLDTDEVEGKRLFIGEGIWKKFVVYNTFSQRLAFKVVRWRTEDKLLKWDKDLSGEKDTGFITLLYTVFTETELNTLINMLPIAVPQRILTGIEDKILNEMNELIFGRQLSNLTFEEEQRINLLNLGVLTMGDQKTEVLLGDNATISGDFVVANSIKNSFNKAKSSGVPDELKELLQELAIAVGKMSEALTAGEAKRVARALETLTDEATSEQPQKKWWSVSVDGLTEAAKSIGKIGEPIIQILARIVPFLSSIS